jgi:hypothetical protein
MISLTSGRLDGQRKRKGADGGCCPSERRALVVRVPAPSLIDGRSADRRGAGQWDRDPPHCSRAGGGCGNGVAVDWRSRSDASRLDDLGNLVCRRHDSESTANLISTTESEGRSRLI